MGLWAHSVPFPPVPAWCGGAWGLCERVSGTVVLRGQNTSPSPTKVASPVPNFEWPCFVFIDEGSFSFPLFCLEN